MKKLKLYALALAMIPGASIADTVLGVYLGAGSWQSEFGGNFNTQGDSIIDVERDIGLSDDSTNILWVALEHPIPAVPNLKLQSTTLKTSESKLLTSTIVFDDITVSSGNVLGSDLDLSHYDAVLYYEVLDNWINLDLGLNVRKFDGEIELAGPSASSAITIDETIPLLYAKGQVELPFSGFFAGAEISAIGVADSKVTDLTMKIGYESDYRFGAELGYRSFNVSLEDVGSLTSDIDIDGFYAAATLHF